MDKSSEKQQQQQQQQQGGPPPTAALLTAAGGAFGAGLLGAIWYTKRKQNQRMQQEIAQGVMPTAPTPHHSPQPYIPPKMTPAEYAIAKKDASLYAFKTLGYGTLLAFGGAGLLATAVGWWLDVRNVSLCYLDDASRATNMIAFSLRNSLINSRSLCQSKLRG